MPTMSSLHRKALGLFLLSAFETGFDALAFTPPDLLQRTSNSRCRRWSEEILLSEQKGGGQEGEWTSDFDEWIGGDAVPEESQGKAPAPNTQGGLPHFKLDSADDTASEDGLALTQLFEEQRQSTSIVDRTAIQTRQFSLGEDLVLSDYVGNLGFDEVTDWEYYYPEEDGDGRKVVQPNPFDSNQPKRTRVSSGSVVRIFRGEFVGVQGGLLSSKGQDKRVLVKEFTGTLPLQLASSELKALATLQSSLLDEDDDWTSVASARTANLRKDQMNVAKLVGLLQPAPFMGILGEVNLAELEGVMEPNEFYRALGVPPPKPEAVWLVYEYAGLSTVQAYAQPPLIRRAAMPIKKGFFGNLVTPDPLPPWKTRAKYVVQGMVKGAIAALADVHESGLVHRSLGRTSIVLSSKTQDKREAVSIHATLTSNLIVKLSDFGFALPQSEVTTDDPDFVTRARTFGLSIGTGQKINVQIANFAMAEDMHALGFVVLALMLSSLAELVTPEDPVPPTDEDTLQRLLGEIFDKDVKGQFRDYVMNEEIWGYLVELLDEDGGAGWSILDSLVNAREKAAAATTQENLISVRGLLNNPFFS
mmetsp:Transcript_13806/g.38146  ORF Transcript_13806/g.38146 Transcript_13806/m.38146 type:complete len:588 (-) Transcript_13806:299-2062(-)